MAFFPFMIQMSDKQCVIGGGGLVAYRKASQMLLFGANVKLIAPEICDELITLEQEHKALTLIQRPFFEEDIKGADVVVMATNQSELNSYIASLCKAQKILVNVVDVKKDCTFYFPAIIKQEDVVISVSTGGHSPALAAQIKKSVESHLPSDCGGMAKVLGKRREKVLKEEKSEEKRKEIMLNMVKQEWKKSVIRIGTRKSELAKIQTGLVISKLQERFPEYQYEIVLMTTKGDKDKKCPIPSFGGKAVFVEEFEQALLEDTIDLAVHSAKDMPNPCKEGLTVAGVLPRECVQDVLIYKKGTSFTNESVFTIGTGSLRRQCQIQKQYPHAVCKNLRGNIGTRLEKLRAGEYDAIVLAAAGIRRQGIHKDPDFVYQYLSTEDMVPAAGQAVIAMETKKGSLAEKLAGAISDEDTAKCLLVERAVLTKKNAGCHEPIGVLCTSKDEEIKISLMEEKEGRICHQSVSGNEKDWKELVEKLCQERK